MKITSALVALFVICAGSESWARQMEGESWVAADGESVTVNLKAVKDLVKKLPPDASGFTVRYEGKRFLPSGKNSWTVSVPGVTPEGGALRISHPDLSLSIGVGFRAAKHRYVKSGFGKSGKREVVWFSLHDPRDGKWRLRNKDKRFPVAVDGNQPTVDGVSVSEFTPLLKNGRSSFYVAGPDRFTEWRTVGQKAYGFLLKEDWNNYVSLFNRYNRKSAEKGNASMYWRAIRNVIKKHYVEEFRYLRTNQSSLPATQKRLFFARIDDEGKKVGIDTSLIVILEDGRWRLYQLSP